MDDRLGDAVEIILRIEMADDADITRGPIRKIKIRQCRIGADSVRQRAAPGQAVIGQQHIEPIRAHCRMVGKMPGQSIAPLPLARDHR